MSAFEVPWNGSGWIRSSPGTIAWMSACHPAMRSSDPAGVGGGAVDAAAAAAVADGAGVKPAWPSGGPLGLGAQAATSAKSQTTEAAARRIGRYYGAVVSGASPQGGV